MRIDTILAALVSGLVSCGGGRQAPATSSPRVATAEPVATTAVLAESAATAPEIVEPAPPTAGDDVVSPPPADERDAASTVAAIRKVRVVETWALDTALGDGEAPVVGPRHVLLTGNDLEKGLVVVDKTTGKVIWEKPLVTSAFAIGDVVVAWRPFQVFEADTGKLLWRREGIMRYLDAAGSSDRLAFVSVEKNPMRYRLTLAELRTGREIMFADHTGPSFERVETRTALSFDGSGPWIAQTLVPLDAAGFDAAWQNAVGERDLPCDTKSDVRRVLTFEEGNTVRLFERSAPKAGLWTFDHSDVLPGCTAPRLLLDGDRIFSGAAKVGDRLHFVRHAANNGSIVWERDDLHFSRRPLPMPFGLFLPGAPGADGPVALDHEGKDIPVEGPVPFLATADGTTVYARDGGRLVRLDLRAQP